MEKVIVEIDSKVEVEPETKVEVWIAGKKIIEDKKEKVEQSESNTRHNRPNG